MMLSIIFMSLLACIIAGLVCMLILINYPRYKKLLSMEYL